VPQDCALFPGTVKDNISRFDISAGVDPARVDEMAVTAAKAAGVHELILSLPGGYDAKLGPRGRGLSAGQQQRIALARAMYGEPILYIFDEPNSNLDSEGEAILVDVITRLRARGALVIVAAHRLSLIASADLLAVMREGRLERFGPRNDILESLKQQQQPQQRPAARPSGAPVGALGGSR
jgi:ABC-type protease/lipase transport system fused ATPase/permease subunit